MAGMSARAAATVCKPANSAPILPSLRTRRKFAARKADRLGEAIPAAMQRASIPGAVVGIWQDGSEPYVRAFGVRDTATGQPMATDLYMRIGSNSKAFTITSLLMLADQGKLGLDDPIDRYVEGVPNGNQITLRCIS